MRLDRGASDTTDREETVVLEHELAALAEQRKGLERQQRELEIVAPFAGQIVELLPALHADRSLTPREAVVVVRGGNRGQVRGVLDERDVWRLKEGADAVFVPNDLNLPQVAVHIQSIALSAMATLDQVELAGSHGGRVADRLDARRQPVPVAAQYGVRGEVVGSLPDILLVRSATGVLVAAGAPESALSRAWRQVLKVLVRESGL